MRWPIHVTGHCEYLTTTRTFGTEDTHCHDTRPTNTSNYTTEENNKLTAEATRTSMRETEGPQPQVRSRVRDRAEHVFNGMNELVDEDLAKLELKNDHNHQSHK